MDFGGEVSTAAIEEMIKKLELLGHACKHTKFESVDYLLCIGIQIFINNIKLKKSQLAGADPYYECRHLHV